MLDRRGGEERPLPSPTPVTPQSFPLHFSILLCMYLIFFSFFSFARKFIYSPERDRGEEGEISEKATPHGGRSHHNPFFISSFEILGIPAHRLVVFFKPLGLGLNCCGPHGIQLFQPSTMLPASPFYLVLTHSVP